MQFFAVDSLSDRYGPQSGMAKYCVQLQTYHGAVSNGFEHSSSCNRESFGFRRIPASCRYIATPELKKQDTMAEWLRRQIRIRSYLFRFPSAGSNPAGVVLPC